MGQTKKRNPTKRVKREVERMGLYERLLQERERAGQTYRTTVPQEKNPVEHASVMRHGGSVRPLEVKCPVCGADPGQHCVFGPTRQRSSLDNEAHTDRVTAWRKGREAEEAQAPTPPDSPREASRSSLSPTKTQPNPQPQPTPGKAEKGNERAVTTWVLDGVRYTRPELLAVQCPRCAAQPEEECRTQGGNPLQGKGIHTDRKKRAVKYWEEA